MAKICILDEDESKPIPPFLQNSFKELGHEIQTVYAQAALTESTSLIKNFKPDLIVTIQNVGLLALDILSQEAFQKIPKAILFYDEPIGSLWLFGRKHPFFLNPEENHVTFFIWDGYWAQQMNKETKAKCFLTHLSAETEYFSPGKQDLIPNIKDFVVFMGNVPSRKVLGSIYQELPAIYQKVAMSVEGKITSGDYGANPYHLLEESIEEQKEDDRELILENLKDYLESSPDFSKPLSSHIQLRRYAWLVGKRRTRLRALRELAKAAPLAILSNLKEEYYMGNDEFRTEIKPSQADKVVFIDTSDANYYQLGHLYASGIIQFQTTDPQSVNGGIPYRMFQSAACGVPLISDYKKELVDCFSPGEEFLVYKNEAEIGELVTKAVQDPSALKTMANRARERFLKEHTWLHRAKSILSDLNIS